MLIARKSKERGFSKSSWLDSYHSFSFADYFDPRFMGFSSLRVINEDWIKASEGFGLHPHRNMEIITYVVDGALEHRDSLGTGSVIRPGEIQRMSAGQGIRHSEFNHSDAKPLHLLQIWILPAEVELVPSYEQKTIEQKKNHFILIGSNNPSEAAVKIHQDVNVYVTYLDEGKKLSKDLDENRKGWLQLIKGELDLSGLKLFPGDGLSIEKEKSLTIACPKEAEFLFFDLV